MRLQVISVDDDVCEISYVCDRGHRLVVEHEKYGGPQELALCPCGDILAVGGAGDEFEEIEYEMEIHHIRFACPWGGEGVCLVAFPIDRNVAR